MSTRTSTIPAETHGDVALRLDARYGLLNTTPGALQRAWLATTHRVIPKLHRAWLAATPVLALLIQVAAVFAPVPVATKAVDQLLAPHIDMVVEMEYVLGGSTQREPVDVSPLVTFGAWVLITAVLLVVFMLIASVVATRMNEHRAKVLGHKDEGSSVRPEQDETASAPAPAPTTRPSGSLGSRQEQLNVRWRQALEQHETLDGRWHAYENDLDSILARPLMRNLNDTAVATAVRAKALADNLREEHPPQIQAGQQLSNVAHYLNAVSNYEHALNAAEQKADAQGVQACNPAERSSVKRARTLLALAMGPNTPAAERTVAYTRVIHILEKLTTLRVPDTALERLAI